MPRNQVNTIQLSKVLHRNGSKKYAMCNCNLQKMHSDSPSPEYVKRTDTIKLIPSFSEIASVMLGKD